MLDRHVLLLGCLALALAACESGAALGTSCARGSDCQGGLVCRYGRCRSECVENRDCPTGASCLQLRDGLGACGVDLDLGCETGVGRMCPTGLVCAADRCEASCMTDADCPRDGVCLPLGTGASFCFDTRGDRDAGITPRDTGGDAEADANTVRELVPAREVCLGANGGCVLGTDGGVYCWGSNLEGRIGDGGETCPPPLGTIDEPQPVRDETGSPLAGVDAIACGDTFACAHTTGGVWCWGGNVHGQLGRGAAGACSLHAAPVNVSGGVLSIPTVPQMSASRDHACALDRVAGVIWCWGRDDGAIFGTTADLTYAVDLGASRFIYPSDDPRILAIADRGGCVLEMASAEVACWGDNDRAQCGSAPGGPVASAEAVTLDAPPTDLVGGRLHRCVLSATGEARCWGDFTRDQLGGTPAARECGDLLCASTAVLLPGSLRLYARLAASGSGSTTCGIGRTGGDMGQVYCWGENGSAQAGAAPSLSVSHAASAPVMHGGAPLANVTRIALGPTTACAIDDAGALWCWGDTDFDALSTGVPSATAVPFYAP